MYYPLFEESYIKNSGLQSNLGNSTQVKVKKKV